MKNQTFDTLQCKNLIVFDDNEKPRIVITGSPPEIVMIDDAGVEKVRVHLDSNGQGSINIFHDSESFAATELGCTEMGNGYVATRSSDDKRTGILPSS